MSMRDGAFDTVRPRIPETTTAGLFCVLLKLVKHWLKNNEAEFNSVRQGDGWIGAHAIPGIQRRGATAPVNYGTLRGSFSAVSRPIFASKY